MTRTRGEPPRQHAGPLPMECDYSKKLNGRCPADSPRLPIYNEPEISATERQRGGKHAYAQEKPARNALETRTCRAMNAMGSLSRSRRGAPTRGKVDSPLFAIHDHELVASGAGAGAGASRPDALGAGASVCRLEDPGAGAGVGRPDASPNTAAGAGACRSDDPGAGAARPDASPNAAAGAGARTKRCRTRKARAQGCDRAPSPRSRGS